MVSQQFLLFCIVGGASALIDIGVMQLFMSAGVHYGISTSLGFFISLVFNFIFQAKVTFKAVSSIAVIFKFVCLVAINYLFTMAFVICGKNIFDQALVGKVLSLPVIAVNSFLWSRYWVFSRR